MSIAMREPASIFGEWKIFCYLMPHTLRMKAIRIDSFCVFNYELSWSRKKERKDIVIDVHTAIGLHMEAVYGILFLFIHLFYSLIIIKSPKCLWRLTLVNLFLPFFTIFLLSVPLFPSNWMIQLFCSRDDKKKTNFYKYFKMNMREVRWREIPSIDLKWNLIDKFHIVDSFFGLECASNPMQWFKNPKHTTEPILSHNERKKGKHQARILIEGPIHEWNKKKHSRIFWYENTSRNWIRKLD